MVTSPLPDCIGPYRVLGILGQGGMGVVYLAEQESPRRRVAVKVLRQALTSEESLHRFRYESAALARLRHACVGQIYDVGSITSPTGGEMPYFAMELVEGALPLVEYARRANLTLEQRLALGLRVLDGVQHGHQRGVIHRDLKPANVQVDQEGNPKIIDFGLARVTEEEGVDADRFTEAGQLLGTIEYMSPEQLAGLPGDVDVRSDVYAMGVVLYELVSGEPPFALKGLSLDEIIRTVRERPPRRLSSLDHRLRADLQTIIERAMAKEPERRYPSASALAADLRRLLRNEPIAARPSSVFYHMRLFTRRNRSIVASIAAVALALVAGTVISARFAVLAGRRAEDAQRQAYRANILAAGLALDGGQKAVALSYLKACSEPLRGWEWRHFEARLHEEAAMVSIDAERVPILAMLADGRTVAAAPDPPGFLIAAPDGSQESLVLAGAEHFGAVGRLLALPDGGLLALSVRPDPANPGQNLGHVGLWGLDGRAGNISYDLPAPLADLGFALSPDGARIACFLRGAVVVLRTIDGTELARRDGTGIFGLTPIAWSHDGLHLAVQGEDDALHILDADSLDLVRRLPGQSARVEGLAWDPHDARIASGSEDGRVLVWTLGDEEPSRPLALEGHAGSVLDVAWHPSRPLLASVSNDHTLRIWDPERPALLRTQTGHEGWVWRLAFVPDGDQIVTSSADGTMRTWDLGLLEETTVLRGHSSYVNPVAISRDGAWVASGGWDYLTGAKGSLRIWDAATGEAVGAWGRGSLVQALGFSPDGKRLLAGGDQQAWVVALPTGTLEQEISGLSGFVYSVGFRPGGELVLCEGQDVLFLSPGASVADRTLPWPNSRVSRDGHYLLSNAEGRLRILDLETLAELPAFPAESGRTELDPFERYVAVVSGDRVLVYDREDGVLRRELPCPRAFSLAFSPDGTRLAAGTSDGPIYLWDLRTFEPVGQLLGHRSYVYELAYDTSGEMLVSGCGDATVRRWVTRSPAEILRERHARSHLLRSLRAGLGPDLASLTPAELLRQSLALPAAATPLGRRLADEIVLGTGLPRIR